MMLAGKRILVAGFARTGRAVVDFLMHHDCSIQVSESRPAADFGDLAGQYPQVRFEFGGHNRETFLNADTIILSPGIPSTLPEITEARRSGIPVIAEIELAFHYLKGTLIGITGTNGKSTTTELTGAMLKEAGKQAFVCGNIGTPLIRFCMDSKPEHYYVAEISSFQLETIRQFRPHIAAILNLAEDHLDWYPSVEPYYRAKMRIFENQTAGDFAVLNYDDPYLRENAGSIGANRFWFSRKTVPPSGIYARDGLLRVVSGMPVLNFTNGMLQGMHNQENTLCAASLALLCGVLPKQMQNTIEHFHGLPHRMELIAEKAGVRYYDDSKATNVDAVVKSLESFSGNVILIMGGRDKGCDYRVLQQLVRTRVKRLLLIGEASERIAQDLNSVSEPQFCVTLEEAVERAANGAASGDIVLLSPACSSFDMFVNYEERGKAFQAAVQSITTKKCKESQH